MASTEKEEVALVGSRAKNPDFSYDSDLRLRNDTIHDYDQGTVTHATLSISDPAVARASRFKKVQQFLCSMIVDTLPSWTWSQIIVGVLVVTIFLAVVIALAVVAYTQ